MTEESTLVSVVEECELIGPGHKRNSDEIHMGYWTPELARWTDTFGFSEKRDLQSYTWVTGYKVTGAEVNASPIICIVRNQIGHEDLTVQVSGLLGESSGYIEVGDTGISGYSIDWQYNIPILRRYYTTGGGNFNYQFTVPAYTKLGKIFKLPTKRLYKITDINVSPQHSNQPLTDLRFYALTDNGSKLLYTINWNKIYDQGRELQYSMFGHPNKCPRCNGSGYIVDISDTCIQCDGYGYNGPNATGYIMEKLAKSIGLEKTVDDTDEVYRNKFWAYNAALHLIPTKNEIQSLFAHFARIETGEVGIERQHRSYGPTGIESIVNVSLPYNIPLSIFPSTDGIWSELADKVEPAGVKINFSFSAQVMTGAFEFEDLLSIYRSGYVNQVYTGLIEDPGVFGFYDENQYDTFGNQWYDDWGEDYFMFNLLLPDVHPSGDDCRSGYQMISGVSYTWQSGAVVGSAWEKWAEPAEANGQGGTWTTGGQGINMNEFYGGGSGTYYCDNFWSSGIGAQGIQY